MLPEARVQVEAAMTPSSKTRLALTVEEIVSETPDVTYEVYINLPKGEPPSYKSVYFVGNLAPFLPRVGAHEQPFVVSFDITRNVRELRSLNVWKDADLSVTFVKSAGSLIEKGSSCRSLPVCEGA
jgi:hypothetical protein